MESGKIILMNLVAAQQWRNRHRKQTYGQRGRGRGRCIKKVTWKLTVCKIDSQWEFAVGLRELKQGLCINLEGCDGEGDGRELQEGGAICIPVADSC